MNKTLLLVLGLILIFTFSNLLASDSDYPELAVTPRASEKVVSEAGKEKNLRWTMHVPVQASSFVTLLGAMMHKDKSDPASGANTLGIAIGGGFLIGTFALSALHTPYINAYQETFRMPNKSAREQLSRERINEQAINDAAALGKRIAIISTASNLFANAYMFINAKNKSSGQTFNLLGVITSFAPIVFKTRWESVAEQHNEYKKRIYGPITSIEMIPIMNGNSLEFAPAGVLAFSF